MSNVIKIDFTTKIKPIERIDLSKINFNTGFKDEEERKHYERQHMLIHRPDMIPYN